MLRFIAVVPAAVAAVFSNFNTSHVTVYLNDLIYDMAGYLFQYISCYGLSYTGELCTGTWKISIHLMLRFIGLRRVALERGYLISIHLMLRFISKEYQCMSNQ